MPSRHFPSIRAAVLFLAAVALMSGAANCIRETPEPVETAAASAPVLSSVTTVQETLYNLD